MSAGAGKIIRITYVDGQRQITEETAPLPPVTRPVCMNTEEYGRFLDSQEPKDPYDPHA